MHRKLTPGSEEPVSVITYSIDPPTSGACPEVNNTPPELMFLVKPDCVTRSAPVRVMATGNCSVNRRVRLCSTVRI